MKESQSYHNRTMRSILCEMDWCEPSHLHYLSLKSFPTKKWHGPTKLRNQANISGWKKMMLKQCFQQTQQHQENKNWSVWLPRQPKFERLWSQRKGKKKEGSLTFSLLPCKAPVASRLRKWLEGTAKRRSKASVRLTFLEIKTKVQGTLRRWYHSQQQNTQAFT